MALGATLLESRDGILAPFWPKFRWSQKRKIQSLENTWDPLLGLCFSGSQEMPIGLISCMCLKQNGSWLLANVYHSAQPEIPETTTHTLDTDLRVWFQLFSFLFKVPCISRLIEKHLFRKPFGRHIQNILLRMTCVIQSKFLISKPYLLLVLLWIFRAL